MRRVMPTVAVIVFIVLVVIGESKIRSSAKWPPPARHQLGEWVVDDPSALTWAAALNVPATIPITYAFGDALDVHALIVYVPWTILVVLLWYFVGYHFDQFVTNEGWKSATQKYLVFSAQTLLTVELLCTGIVSFTVSPENNKTVAVVSFWVWALAAIAGWINLIRLARRGASAAA